MTFNKSEKIEAYHLMRLIRRFEEKCAQLYSEGDIGGFLHLYIGQEPLAVACKYALAEDDNVITAYRDHGLAIARGMHPNNVMAEMLGKQTGVSGGYGGSMHMGDVERRFWGGWAIVGSHIPIASGLALADHYRGDERVTVCFMGDGSTNIGLFHEGLNLAGVWELPIVWVIENNEYGMGTAVDRASAITELYRKAEAYGMPGERIDVDTPETIYKALHKAVEETRSGGGPRLIEARTYRYRGHSMGDAERYRSSEEVEERMARDPIELWREYLIDKGWQSEEEIEATNERVEQEVQEAVEFSRSSEDTKDLFTNVYNAN